MTRLFEDGKAKDVGAPPVVSIIIPCYHDAPHLPESVKEIDRVMKNSAWSYELIFVVDGGEDNTDEVVAQLEGEATNRKAIYHDVNQGRGAAVTTGLRAAQGDVSGFLDIDLEVHARYLPEAISSILDKNLDVVVGRRDYRIHMNLADLSRHLLSVVYKKISHAMLNATITDTESGYKFFRHKKILPLLDEIENRGWFWDTESILVAQKNNLTIGEFDCLFVRRRDKRSTVRPIGDTIRYLLDIYRYKKNRSKSR